MAWYKPNLVVSQYLLPQGVVSMWWLDRLTSNKSEDDNPGDSSNAGDLGSRNEAEAQAARDYESSVGSDSHAQEVSDAREGSGFDDSSSPED